MRSFSTLSLITLLLGTRASSHDLRAPEPRRLDVRDPTVDVCASLNIELLVPGTNERLTDVGLLDGCFCLSTLPVFLATNLIAMQAVKVAGNLVTIDVLTQLILNQAAQSNCVLPEHGSPACVPNHPTCGFVCSDGFTGIYDSDPPSCVCEAPAVVCNGVCQLSATPCPSAGAISQLEKRKRWVGSGACSEKGPEWAACGVYGGHPHSWECVNTARDLESCGGCAIPLTPYTHLGEDCSAIPGVADVACLYGKCVVSRCLPGLEPSHDGHSCVRRYPQLDDELDVSASVYGLEHVPLAGALGRQ